MVLDNVEAGLLTIEVEDISFGFSKGVFETSGSLVEVNEALENVIFVPEPNFNEDFAIDVYIENFAGKKVEG